MKFAPLVALAAVMAGLMFFHVTWAMEVIAIVVCGHYFYRRRLS